MSHELGLPADDESVKEWRLEVESELRLEVGAEHTIDLQLMKGSAEVFGTEMAKGKVYTITTHSKIAVFTYFGCSVKVIGSPEVVYVSHETPMVMYLNSHVAIDQLRRSSAGGGGGGGGGGGDTGAKVLVVGPPDVGKSSVCKILLNYAVRMGRQPCFVDVDVGQGSISIPGSLGVLPIEKPCDIESGQFNKQAALVYHFGHNSPGPNIKLYNTLVSTLAEMFQQRCAGNPTAKAGGCVINSCGWVDGGGYKALLHAARAFEVDVVLVLDHERLYNDLQRELPRSTNVVALPKSGGVVVRTRDFRRLTRSENLREYFYGKKPHSLFPFSFDVPFSQVQIFKIGAPSVPESALPLGMKQEDGSTHLVPVEPDRELTHTILSLSMATSLEEGLVTMCSAGFICVTAVNMEEKVLTVLAPAPRPLPRKFLLLSDCKFMDLR